MHTLDWLAGLLEGEGCFMVETIKGRKSPAITLFMTDRDVIENARLHFGVTFVKTISLPDRKPAYRIRVRGKKAATLMRAVLPYMGERRKAKIEEVLSVTGY